MFRSFAIWFFVAALGLIGAERYLDRANGRTHLAPSNGAVHSTDDGAGIPPCGC